MLKKNLIKRCRLGCKNCVMPDEIPVVHKSAPGIWNDNLRAYLCLGQPPRDTSHSTIHSRPRISSLTWNLDQQLRDDVMPWTHFPHNWPFVRGIFQSPADFPHKWSMRRNVDISIDLKQNKLLNIQSSCRWFTMPWRSFDVTVVNAAKAILGTPIELELNMISINFEQAM